MSLTSFISTPEIKRIFIQSFKMPKLELNDIEPSCQPITTHYGMIGTAFDYLLRFYIKANNPDAIEKPWIAENSVKLIKDPDIFKNASKILKFAKDTYKKYLKSKKITENLIKASIYLAQLDPIYRAGVVDPNLGKIEKEDIIDLRCILNQVDIRNFEAKNICLLNPTFGMASILVGGADADLVIDDTIIDIKTVKHLDLTREYYNQLLGYYFLYKIGGIDGYKKNLEIKKLGIYFSRHGKLIKFNLSDAIKGVNIESFINWFKTEAKRRFNPINV